MVVQHIGSTFASADLSLKNLSMKLVMLMALSNASRASDLASLDIRFQQFTPEGVKFFVPGLTKTRRSGPPKEAFFGRFHEKSLCPVNTLILYEEKTKDLRMSTPNEPSPLLISFRKPHKPVTPASIGRWIKELLGKAGINTEIFKGHSSRAASSSAAKVQGVSVAEILATAGWSRKSTFERFYYKPSEGSNFSKAVLSCTQGKSLNHTLVIYEALPRRGINDLTRIYMI